MLAPGATLALYTDGLVERRDRDIDTGLQTLGRTLADSAGEALAALPGRLTAALDLATHDDDVALLMVRLRPDGRQDDLLTWHVTTAADAVSQARQVAVETLHGWRLPRDLVDDAALAVSELVTNAVLHGLPPIRLQLRRTSTALVVEVCDGATFLPRRMRPSPEDEHGRGVQLVALLADRWGARPTAGGKATWCMFSLSRPAGTQRRPGRETR